jgi:hypothetical protein
MSSGRKVITLRSVWCPKYCDRELILILNCHDLHCLGKAGVFATIFLYPLLQCPHHRRFKKGITACLGGVGFKLTVCVSGGGGGGV